MQAVAILIGLEAALVAAAYLIAGRDRRFAALLLIAATAPLEVYRTVVAKFDVSLFRLSLLIAVFVLLFEGGHRAALTRLAKQPLVRAYAVFAGVVLVAMLVHPINVFLAKRELAQVLVGAVALGVVAELARSQPIKRTALAIVLGGVLPILAAAWQGIAPEVGVSEALPLLDKLPAAEGLEITRQALSSFGRVGARAKGPFGDPNHFGVYMGFVIWAAAGLTLLAAQRRERTAQIAYGAMAVAAVATLVASFSRSAWVGAVAAGLVFAAGVVLAWRRRALRPPDQRFAIAASVAVIAISAGVASRVVERVEPSSKINVASDRYHSSTVRFAWHQFLHHPAIGIGPGGLGIKLHAPPRTSGAHSTYLSVAAELGVAGLIALFLAIGTALRMLFGAYQRLRGSPLVALAVALGAAYVGFMASNVTYDIWFDDFHWMMLGAISAFAAEAARQSRRGEAATSEPTPSGWEQAGEPRPTLAARLSRLARQAWPV